MNESRLVLKVLFVIMLSCAPCWRCDGPHENVGPIFCGKSCRQLSILIAQDCRTRPSGFIPEGTLRFRLDWKLCDDFVEVSPEMTLRDAFARMAHQYPAGLRADNVSTMTVEYVSGESVDMSFEEFADVDWQRRLKAFEIARIKVYHAPCKRPSRLEKVVYGVCAGALCPTLRRWRPAMLLRTLLLPGDHGEAEVRPLQATVLRRNGREGEGIYTVFAVASASELLELPLEPFDAVVLREADDDAVFTLGELHVSERKAVEFEPFAWLDGIAPLAYPVALRYAIVVRPDRSTRKVPQLEIDSEVSPGDIVFYPPFVACETFEYSAPVIEDKNTIDVSK